jgi:hypothetical protein
MAGALRLGDAANNERLRPKIPTRASIFKHVDYLSLARRQGPLARASRSHKPASNFAIRSLILDKSHCQQK